MKRGYQSLKEGRRGWISPRRRSEELDRREEEQKSRVCLTVNDSVERIPLCCSMTPCKWDWLMDGRTQDSVRQAQNAGLRVRVSI